MNNFIKLDDDTCIRLKKLPEMVPHESFMGNTHIQVCEQFARLNKLPDNLFGVYVNYLFTKSKRTKQLTSLVLLIQAKKLKVNSVTSSFIAPVFVNLLGYDIDILLLKRKPTSLIDTRQFFIFSFKVLSHRLFRIFRQHNIRSKSVTRAWVDTTDRIFPERIYTSFLLIYPFSGNKVRQLRYLWLCMVEKRQFSIIGLNYKLIDALRIFINWKNRTELILLSEINAYQEHAHEIIAMGAKKIFTTDEFEMAGHYLHERLIGMDCKCHNICHGMAVYGPYVTFTHMSFYSRYQDEFYSRRGKFSRSNLLTFPIIKPDSINDCSTSDPVVVFVQGNWKQVGKVYEANFERQAITLTKQLCEKLDVQFILKVHPNLRYQWLKRKTSKIKAVTISNVESLKDKRVIFINIQSSAYYSFLQYGPTIFLEDNLLKPKTIFGEFIDSVRLDELHESLRQFCESEWWLLRYKSQLSSIEDKKEKTVKHLKSTIL